MTTYYLSVPDLEDEKHEYKHFEVPHSVYVYVKQLEFKLKEMKAYNSVPHYTYYTQEFN